MIIKVDPNLTVESMVSEWESGAWSMGADYQPLDDGEKLQLRNILEVIDGQEGELMDILFTIEIVSSDLWITYEPRRYRNEEWTTYPIELKYKTLMMYAHNVYLGLNIVQKPDCFWITNNPE